MAWAKLKKTSLDHVRQKSENENQEHDETKNQELSKEESEEVQDQGD